MANSVYPKGIEGVISGAIVWPTDTMKLVLVDSTYVYSSAHDNLDDVVGSSRIATSGAFTAKTYAGGVLDADDVTLNAVDAVPDVAGVVVFKDTGVESTSRLLLFLDAMTGLPLDVDGSDVVVRWPAAGIVQL